MSFSSDFQWNLGHFDVFESQINEGFLCISKVSKQSEAQSGFSGVGAEAAGHIGKFFLGNKIDNFDHPLVAPNFNGRHIGDVLGITEASGGNKISLAMGDGVNESRDVLRIELAVGIDIHNDGGAGLQGGFQAGLEGGADALIVRMRDDGGAGLTRQGNGGVSRAIINNYGLDSFDAGQVVGNTIDDIFNSGLFVEGGDDNGQFWGRGV